MNIRNRKIRREYRDLRSPAARSARLVAAILMSLPAASLPVTAGATTPSAGPVVDAIQEGLISWYGGAFHAKPTASGEPFDKHALTMAHPTLPFGTQVRVTNLRNGRSVVLRVNDRGPFVGARVADVSHAAAETLGMMRRGIVRARIEVLGVNERSRG
jgi:rare lipoprotein A